MKNRKDVFNFRLLKDVKFSSSGMPIIFGTEYVPKSLISFNYAKTYKNKDVGIHFYIDDYQFERVWNEPFKYTNLLKNFDCVIGPDFSLHTNFPKPLRLFNLYKQRLLTAFWQSKGICVIPNLTWSSLEDLDECLEGFPKHSVIALSTNGCLNKRTKERFLECFNKAIQIIEPLKIILVGEIPTELKNNKNIVQFYSHSKHFENLKKRSKV